MDAENEDLRRVRWVGDTRERVQEFPSQVRKDIGHAIYIVQTGQTPKNARPMRGLGSGVFEIASDHARSTYRAVYAVKIGEFIYLLHAFQKKSKSGIATPGYEIDLIRRRLRRAEELAKQKEANNG